MMTIYAVSLASGLALGITIATAKRILAAAADAGGSTGGNLD